MVKYILKRILYIIPTFVLLTFIVFSALSLSGDPAPSILGPTATQDQIEQLREDLGLNENLLLRYAKYMLNLLRGDMGNSWYSDTSVFRELIIRLPRTVTLAALAIVLTILIGIPLGVLVAVKQYSMTDRITTITTMFFISMPSFFLALLAQLIFSVRMGILPATGIGTFQHFIMPSAMLGAAQIATQVRMTRSSMLDVIGQDYIRTAYAKGAPKRRVIFRHALRNALLPVITSVGNAVSGLLAGSAVIEAVFAIPGIGSMVINAVRVRDIPLVMGPIVLICLMVCVVSMVVDIIYAVVDPRIRVQFTNK